MGGSITFGKRIEPKQTPLVDPSHPQPRITDTPLNAFKSLLMGIRAQAGNTKGKDAEQPRKGTGQATRQIESRKGVQHGK